MIISNPDYTPDSKCNDYAYSLALDLRTDAHHPELGPPHATLGYSNEDLARLIGIPDCPVLGGDYTADHEYACAHWYSDDLPTITIIYYLALAFMDPPPPRPWRRTTVTDIYLQLNNTVFFAPMWNILEALPSPTLRIDQHHPDPRTEDTSQDPPVDSDNGWEECYHFCQPLTSQSELPNFIHIYYDTHYIYLRLREGSMPATYYRLPNFLDLEMSLVPLL
tara:strand:+ start:511 stop:1173 length:663 start_codon:yes stop_codon:yes gene_type:complete